MVGRLKEGSFVQNKPISMRNLLISAIILMILGMMLTLLGALFKLESWEGATMLLSAGTIAWLVAMLLLIVYLVKKRSA